MKAAVYARVSTDKQELDNQLLQLREYAKTMGWTIVKEYCDIISGKENSRPSFDQLFVDAGKRQFDIVLFWDISRFSRSGTLYTLQKLDQLEKYGVNWHSYQEPMFSSVGQFRDVVLSLMSTLAKIEREKISERTKAGLARARAAGARIGKRGPDVRPRKRRTALG